MSSDSLKNQPKQKSGRAIALPALPLRGPCCKRKCDSSRTRDSKPTFFCTYNSSTDFVELDYKLLLFHSEEESHCDACSVHDWTNFVTCAQRATWQDAQLILPGLS